VDQLGGRLVSEVELEPYVVILETESR